MGKGEAVEKLRKSPRANQQELNLLAKVINFTWPFAAIELEKSLNFPLKILASQM